MRGSRIACIIVAPSRVETNFYAIFLRDKGQKEERIKELRKQVVLLRYRVKLNIRIPFSMNEDFCALQFKSSSM